MTKRVLSMLMALIMALSLCVPAFAADEPVSADEPATEVEAPAAEAEEIEAEEVEAEAEPVDEPAEAAVDEPETAAVDEPLLVTLGIVTKEAHWSLKKTVEAAEKLAADVEAGTVHVKNFDPIDNFDTTFKDYVDDDVDPFEKESGDFADALATAKEYLEGIDGKEVDLDVTDTNVKAADLALSQFLPFNTKNDAGASTLVKTVPDGETLDIIKGYLLGDTNRALATYQDQRTYTTAKNDLKINFNGKDKVTTSAAWTKAYQASYLGKLQTAIDAIVAYQAKYAPTYSEYKTVIYAILNALALEEEGAKPGSAEMTRVNAVIAKTPATKDAFEKANKTYVLGTTWTDLSNGGSGLLDKVVGLKADSASATAEFKSGKTLWEVNDDVAKLENALIEPGTTTIKFLEVTGNVNDATNAVVKFTVDNVAGNSDLSSATKMDGHQYGIAWRVKTKDGEKWHDGNSGTDYEPGKPVPTAVIKELIKTSVGFSTTWVHDEDEDVYYVQGNVANYTGKFAEGDVVTMYIFVNEGTDEKQSWTQILMKDFKIGPAEDPAPLDAWPTIKEAKYNAPSNAGVIAEFEASDTFESYTAADKLTGAFESGSETGATITVKLSNDFNVTDGGAENYDIWVVIKDSNGKVVYTGTKLAVDDGNITIDAGTAEGQFDDSALKAGTYTVELHSCKKGQMKEGVSVVRAKKTFTIASLNTWEASTQNQRKNVETVLAAAEALVPSDYVITEGSEVNFKAKTDEGMLSEAFELIQKNIDGIRAVLNDATAGSTMTNHNKVGRIADDNATCLYKLLTVISYLEAKPADCTELNKLLKQAIDEVGTPGTDFENEGEGKYTFDTRGRLQDAIELAEKMSSDNLQSDVDAVAAELKAALAGLVEIGEIDKSELEASIAAAEALNEDDYTPESWADLEDAIEAAKNVLADEDATQAQLTNAADKLNKAVAALVKKDLTAEDLEEAIAAAEAAIADPSKYTDESVLAVQDAITAAKALGDDATAAEIQEAIDKLDAAVKGLVPAEAEPELKEGWNLIDGEYYYCKDGKMVKSDWVKSKNLWYHMGADGTMDTGFIHIVDSWGDGWYYLEPSNDKGTQGRMRTGWQEVNDELTGQWGWFETRSNGHQGMCTYTTNQGDYKDYKPVK